MMDVTEVVVVCTHSSGKAKKEKKSKTQSMNLLGSTTQQKSEY